MSNICLCLESDFYKSLSQNASALLKFILAVTNVLALIKEYCEPAGYKLFGKTGRMSEFFLRVVIL